LDGHTKSPKTSHVVMRAPFTSPLLVRTFGAAENHTSLEHPIQDNEHQVSYCDYGSLLPFLFPR
jgi:hypothetical protein